MWLKDGQSISRNTSVLILHHAEKYSEGIYAAVFANDFGQILSIGMEIRLSGWALCIMLILSEYLLNTF